MELYEKLGIGKAEGDIFSLACFSKSIDKMTEEDFEGVYKIVISANDKEYSAYQKSYSYMTGYPHLNMRTLPYGTAFLATREEIKMLLGKGAITSSTKNLAVAPEVEGGVDVTSMEVGSKFTVSKIEDYGKKIAILKEQEAAITKAVEAKLEKGK